MVALDIGMVKGHQSAFLQCFALCKHQKVLLGQRLPFCLEVTSMTFEKLDLLLRSVCDGLESSQGVYPSPHKEQECIAVAALNLLKLQVRE